MFGDGEKEKVFGQYHFDKWKEDQRGDYHKIVNIFDLDFSKDMELARSLQATSQSYNRQNYGHAANPASEGHVVEDAANPDGNPSAVMFDKINFEDDVRFPIFTQVAEWFHLDKTKKYTWKFHDQLPNHQLMFHIDNLPGIPLKERVLQKDFKHTHNKFRFLIMLEDWSPGQLLQFGNCIEIQWKKGTAFTWEWDTLPHATWNGSWERRPALQITGTATEKTLELIQ